jgi:hypothetical protein
MPTSSETYPPSATGACWQRRRSAKYSKCSRRTGGCVSQPPHPMPVSVNHRIWGDTGRDLEDKRDVAAIYAARGVTGSVRYQNSWTIKRIAFSTSDLVWPNCASVQTNSAASAGSISATSNASGAEPFHQAGCNSNQRNQIREPKASRAAMVSELHNKASTIQRCSTNCKRDHHKLGSRVVLTTIHKSPVQPLWISVTGAVISCSS